VPNVSQSDLARTVASRNNSGCGVRDTLLPDRTAWASSKHAGNGEQPALSLSPSIMPAGIALAPARLISTCW
jgi:hypothetical protein